MKSFAVPWFFAKGNYLFTYLGSSNPPPSIHKNLERDALSARSPTLCIISAFGYTRSGAIDQEIMYLTSNSPCAN